MANQTGSGHICFVQRVLDYYEVTVIHAGGLRDLIGLAYFNKQRCARILADLGWDKHHITENHAYVYYRNGSYKDFDGGAKSAATRLYRKWARRNEISS